MAGDPPIRTTVKPLAGQTPAAAAAQRRSGCSPEHAARVAAAFAAQHDLRSTCRRCGHHRTGSFAVVSGPCPKCGGGGS